MAQTDELIAQRSARLAQSVERKALNLVVGGSSPPVGDIFFPFFLDQYFVIFFLPMTTSTMVSVDYRWHYFEKHDLIIHPVWDVVFQFLEDEFQISKEELRKVDTRLKVKQTICSNEYIGLYTTSLQCIKDDDA